ncbi:hypothetical protein [Thioalkalivibrio sp. XN279]|uniref:hypothetical protein n=1 Tax=Thioalkalivibrio sp. XN279 TaxID=2714953 RepID=UPI001408517B|nr:hypothetical protein [Thioalkalivibrio sp. XN279]NHA14331.1 hypothetical protein [Thioalkalivibrio sp. XN279]
MNTFKQTTRKLVLLSCAALFSAMVWAAPPEGAGGGGGNRPPGHGEETQGNNLSFPALAVDGYPITAIEGVQHTVPFTGPYTGLSVEEIATLEASGPWYAQKTDGNTWQADYLTDQTVEVTYVDWGDVIESVNPKVGRPFRVEVQLYKLLHEWADFDGTNGMTGYLMAMLANPSSPDEVQGNNKVTYNGNLATVVSNLWKLRIQKCGDAIPSREDNDLYWNVDRWVSPSITCTDEPISFAVELNVGGKLIYGASTGGWKVKSAGWYRITFYGPPGTNLSLKDAVVANYDDFKAAPEPVLAAEEDETGAATPVVDSFNNISYVDVLAVASGGGGGGGKPKAPKSNNGKKGLNK